ncbi:Ig-like domain-containing protein [Lutibacter holmesii]|uniref:Ig-like domain-containing protein n=1 Tax=Lutibacter holmesii TaxID=1137985 RepID=A0ABW3WRF7_9FLAO
MKYHFFKFLIFAFLVLSFTSCAKRGRPTGGEIDEIPPILVSATPSQESVEFSATRIKIFFDEYIKFKDLNKKLIISPPLKNKPEITPVGTASKVITIKLFDTLKENTTYTINFGNSIVDNNEGNMIESFKYVFSTGKHLDSLKLSGDITDAFSRKTDSEILVMLYRVDSTFNDSIVYKEKPTYVTSTLDSTNFELTNLKEGKYLLMALKQPNNDYIYSPRQDKIGFHKNLITLPNDTTFQISLLKEINDFRLIRAIETTKGHIVFGYEGDKTNLAVKLLDTLPESFKPEIAFEKDKDTLSYWFQETEKDSLIFEVTNLNFKDTITVKLKSKKKDSLFIKSTINATLNPRDTFAIKTSIPISKIDTTKVSIVDKDTLAVPFHSFISTYKNELYLNFNKKFEQNYKINILPEALFDVFGNTNDTLVYNLTTKKPEDYGVINLQITNVTSPVIIEVITEKDEIIASKKINSNQLLSFKYLLPKNYIIRAIFDDNENGKWDTGNYLMKTQPEKVLYFNKLIELRANWDDNETFQLK